MILLLLLLALVLAGLLVLRARRRRDREERRLVRDYIEAHSFPGDSVADVLTEHGDVTIAQVRRVSEAYRQGWEDHREQIRRNHTRRAYR